MNERWLPIAEFDGLYEVSDRGRVRNARTKRCLSPTKNGNGKNQYLRLYLRHQSNLHKRYIHRLVLTAFVGSCPEGMMCCHKDTNSQNNNLENLRWGTQADNEADKKLVGKDNAGSRNGCSKLTERQVAFIKRMLEFGSRNRHLASVFNVNPATISDIKRGATWLHV